MSSLHHFTVVCRHDKLWCNEVWAKISSEHDSQKFYHGSVNFSKLNIGYPLNHDVVDAHVSNSSGEVKQINPAHSHTDHQKGKIPLHPD